MDLMQNSFQKSLIFDIGNSATKFGFSSEARPSHIFDTVVRTKLSRAGGFQLAEPKTTGKKASHSCLYRHDTPMVRGVLNSGEDLSIILRHMLEEMKAKTLDNIPVFVCDSLNSSAKQRFKIAETLTNEFKASFMYFADQPTLALYGTGKTSGCLLDVGHGTTQLACVYDNFKISQCCEALNLGGMDVEGILSRLLQLNGTFINPANEYTLLRELKEKHLSLLDRVQATQLRSHGPTSLPETKEDVMLPDGEILKLDDARYLAAEVLFEPVTLNSKAVGVHRFLKNSIERADISLKKEFYSSITVVGGAAQTTNFLPRLREELAALCHPSTRISLQHKGEHAGSEAWAGARVVLASNGYDFSGLWITKNDINEFGEQILFRKCN